MKAYNKGIKDPELLHYESLLFGSKAPLKVQFEW